MRNNKDSKLSKIVSMFKPKNVLLATFLGITALNSQAYGERAKNKPFGYLVLDGGIGTLGKIQSGINGGLEFGVSIIPYTLSGLGVSIMGNKHDLLPVEYLEMERNGEELDYVELSVHIVNGFAFKHNWFLYGSFGISSEQVNRKVGTGCGPCGETTSEYETEKEWVHSTRSFGIKYLGLPTWGIEYDNRRGIVFSFGVGGGYE